MFSFDFQKRNESIKDHCFRNLVSCLNQKEFKESSMLAITMECVNKYMPFFSTPQPLWRFNFQKYNKSRMFTTRFSTIYDYKIFMSHSFYDNTVSTDDVVELINKTDPRYIDLGFLVLRDYKGFWCPVDKEPASYLRVMLNARTSLLVEFDLFDIRDIELGDKAFRNFFSHGSLTFKNISCIKYYNKQLNHEFAGYGTITIECFERYIEALETIGNENSRLSTLAKQKAKNYRNFLERKVYNNKYFWQEFYEFLSDKIIEIETKKITKEKALITSENNFKKITEEYENIPSVDKLLIELLDI